MTSYINSDMYNTWNIPYNTPLHFSDKPLIDPTAHQTADLLRFFDRLFDSVNGSSRKASPEKPLLCAVSKSSRHVQFWSEARKVLETMSYTDGKLNRRTPSLINWCRTIRNIEDLWKKLNKCGFDYLILRNLNQDPLENKFGAIRSHGFRNISPILLEHTNHYF